MKIIKIKKNKEKIKIIFDNKTIPDISLYPSVFEDFKLFINKEVDEQILFNLKKENEIEEFYRISIRKLLTSSPSNKKLKDFLLKKGADKSIINEVIVRLQKYDYLNEEKIADSIVSYCDYKLYGYKRIISKLKEKEISSKYIKDIKYDYSNEFKKAKNLAKRIQNKHINCPNSNKLKQIIFCSLIRYGYSEDIAEKISSSVFITNESEINMLKLDYQKYFSS